MKILHVIPTLSAQAGGPSEVAIHLVKHLNLLGADAEILTTDDNGACRFDVPLRERIYFRDVPVRFFSRIDPRLKEFIISPSAVKWLSAHLHDYDVLDIHYLFSFVPLLARSMARKRNFPYSVRTMGQLSPWALKQSRFKKQVMFSLQEFKNLERADALHSTSKGEENDIRAFGLHNRVINIPLGVEKPKTIEDASQRVRQKYSIHKNAFILLFLSRLHYKKRPDVVIEVAADLKKNYNIHLVVAGSGEAGYEKELMTLVKQHHLADAVTFTGFVEGSEKDELLQGADLFVLPSYSENFGIAVAESLAAGTPVVITSDVQIAEYVEAYQAGIISEGNRHSFLTAVTACIGNDRLMDQFRENGLKLVKERFDWSIIAAELLESYKIIVNRG